jgi:Cu+-exporting ATPase
VTDSLDTTMTDARDPAVRPAPPRPRAGCFHCGEPCPDDSFAQAGKVFCCHGCLTVHELLTGSGLGRFYELGERPGVRVRRASPCEQFAWLDEPALQQRLLDFTDGRTSRVTFHIPAIHCIACVWLLENLFRLHPALGRSRVDFPHRRLTLDFAPDQIRLSELVALLASIGYEPSLTLSETERPAPDSGRKRQWLQVGIAGFAFGNIMLFSLPGYLGMDSFSGPFFRRLFGWLSLALAAPVVAYSAADYWRSAWLSVRQRVVTLDLPIALGLAAIYGQSVWEIATGRGTGYCDSLVGLIFFLLCGRAFQRKTHERLAFDRDYKSFFPLSVTRKGRAGRPRSAARAPTDDGAPGATRPTREERVSLCQLQVGDRLLLRHGEILPADARLVNGPALIDYSFVTGESEPVEKRAGDYLYAGGQQLGAAIEVETVKPVSQSHLTSLWSHEAFQKRGAESLNTLTNRYSRRFTPAVIAVAVGAAAAWIGCGQPARGLKAFTSVLIVACPCALALAAPFALGTAQRLLARLKIFLKHANVVERLARIDTIVFDKTGTLTANTAGAVRFNGPELDDAEQRWLFSLTRHSTHPHAVRIHESFAGRFFPEPVRSFLETPGLGLEGRVNGREIWLGSRAWFVARGVRAAEFTPRESPNRAAPGETPSAGGASAPEPVEGRAPAAGGSAVHLAIDGQYRGVFTLTSTLRPDADRLLRRLAARYEVALLSGDNEKERERFRGLFGGDARLHFQQSPLDKLGFIRRLQESGRTVMMVGDGLNDAGALRQSDVGVAVIEQCGAFSPASDVILEAASVPRLGELLALARRTTRIVRWSFGLSALYNLVGVSIAAAGALSPLVCAVLMPVSSVSVALFACGMTAWAARRAGREAAS